LVAFYFQVEEVYGIMDFGCGLELYIVVNLVYVFANDLGLDFCCVIYDQNVIHVLCVKCYVFCVKKVFYVCVFVVL
jgi:hypothetical protein